MYTLLKRASEFKHSSAFVERRDLFHELSDGQHPKTLFVTCCDSRLNPHLLTGSEPGDLFLLRNIGNIIPPYDPSTEAASAVEYALTGLGIEEIIICGHSHCGAMIGLLNPEKTASMPSVSHWLSHCHKVRDSVLATHRELDADGMLRSVIEANVLASIERLKTHPVVAEKLREKRLKIHGWVYHFEEGEVMVYSKRKDDFVNARDLLAEDRDILATIIQDEAKRVLANYCNPQTASQFRQLSQFLLSLQREGIKPIWELIRASVSHRLFTALKGDYLRADDCQFQAFLSEGEQAKLADSRCFQECISLSRGYQAFCSETLRHSSMWNDMARRMPVYSSDHVSLMPYSLD